MGSGSSGYPPVHASCAPPPLCSPPSLPLSRTITALSSTAHPLPALRFTQARPHTPLAIHSGDVVHRSSADSCTHNDYILNPQTTLAPFHPRPVSPPFPIVLRSLLSTGAPARVGAGQRHCADVRCDGRLRGHHHPHRVHQGAGALPQRLHRPRRSPPLPLPLHLLPPQPHPHRLLPLPLPPPPRLLPVPRPPLPLHCHPRRPLRARTALRRLPTGQQLRPVADEGQLPAARLEDTGLLGVVPAR